MINFRQFNIDKILLPDTVYMLFIHFASSNMSYLSFFPLIQDPIEFNCPLPSFQNLELNRYLDFSFADTFISQHTVLKFSNEHSASSEDLSSFYTFETILDFRH